MPQDSLHMTALEITHSLTDPEIDELVDQVRPGIPEITDYTYSHRARIVKPSLSYDAQAFALSFLPAAGEPCTADPSRKPEDDAYTYHHLRRDLYALTSATGVKVASRYVVPSAHLTVGRFIERSDTEAADGKVDHARMQKLVKVVDEINEWLKTEYWPKDGKTIKAGGEWIVGEGKGLDSRKGALWYGSGGETVRLGKGFWVHLQRHCWGSSFVQNHYTTTKITAYRHYIGLHFYLFANQLLAITNSSASNKQTLDTFTYIYQPAVKSSVPRDSVL